MASELPYTQPGSPYTRPFRRVTLVQEDPFISENERVAIETAQNTKRNSQLTYDTNYPEILRPTNPDSSVDFASDSESIYEVQPVPIRIRTTSTASMTTRPPRNPDRLLSPSSPRFIPMALASTPEPFPLDPSMIPLPLSPPPPPPNYPTATNPRYSDGSASHYSGNTHTNWTEASEKALYGSDLEVVEEKKKKRRRKFIILCLLPLLLIVTIGGGVGGSLASKNNRSSSEVVSSSTTQLTTTTNSAGVVVTFTSVLPLIPTAAQEILPTSSNFNGSILNPIFPTSISSGTPIALSSSFTLSSPSFSSSTSSGAQTKSNSISYNNILTPSPSPSPSPSTPSPDPISIAEITPKTTDQVIATPVQSPSQPQSTPAIVVALPTPVQTYIAATVKATPAAASPVNDNNNNPAQTPVTTPDTSPVATPAPNPTPTPSPSPTTTTQQAASPSVVCVYDGLTILGLNLFGSTVTLTPGAACPTNYQQQ